MDEIEEGKGSPGVLSEDERERDRRDGEMDSFGLGSVAVSPHRHYHRACRPLFPTTTTPAMSSHHAWGCFVSFRAGQCQHDPQTSDDVVWKTEKEKKSPHRRTVIVISRH